MKMVSQRTGLSAHVLRVWERRYEAVTPDRTGTNRRLYSEEEVHRLELMAGTGTMGIDTMDPPPLGNTELADAKARVGSELFLKGNMNPVVLLAAKTEDEIIEHASDRIQDGKPNGGYILSSACSVSPRTEPWKLEMLMPLAEKFGRYER